MMEELIAKVKSFPSDGGEEEFMAIMEETGYDLVPSGAAEDDGMAMEETEAPEDAGPEDAGAEEEEEEDMGQKVLDSFMPFGMSDEEMTPQMTLKVERAGAVHRAMNGDKNKNKDEGVA
tara:strand:- start:1779 stop:2135 length:357 start_codon:yes stop_codon:yes gene_type:complete